MGKLLTASVAILVLGLLSSVVDAAPINSFSIVIPRVDIAAPGQSHTDPSLITWQTYDDFSDPNLNTGLWHEIGGSSGNGTITTGSAGLTMTPQSLSDPGKTSVGIHMPDTVPLGSYFAVRVPFQVANAVTDLTGWVGLNIDLCGPEQITQCDSLSWNQGKDVSINGSAPLSGKAFASEDGLFLDLTTVSKGELAIIYNGDTFTNYVNDGAGWRQLGITFPRPADWDPLRFEMDAEVRISPVPLPASFLLFGAGLAGIGLLKRKFRG